MRIGRLENKAMSGNVTWVPHGLVRIGRLENKAMSGNVTWVSANR